MPLTEKGSEIQKNMREEYGTKKGDAVFYASKNKGTISGVDRAAFIDGFTAAVKRGVSACDALKDLLKPVQRAYTHGSAADDAAGSDYGSSLENIKGSEKDLEGEAFRSRDLIARFVHKDRAGRFRRAVRDAVAEGFGYNQALEKALTMQSTSKDEVPIYKQKSIKKFIQKMRP